ncbi:nitrilase-related carbon-nitrogen hydrolase [Geothrix fermentans]|uniref:nitrilase-related carbon-nitrogen hydrolase n=1 Tax=Geothrix fermentans TaxID=44676 RepID=UPI0003F96D2E|nr:nitrilase-related carbon-nitrogen hydrolase [Geothrix fermentans]
MTTLRVALVQQDTVWQDPAANLARARGFAEAAARAGARVAVFPELFALGFTMAPEPFAESIPGPTTKAVAALSREFGLYLVGSCVEAHAPHPRNAAFVTGPDGALIAAYRKIHPFSYGEEHQHYSGGEDCPLFEVDGIPCGLQICYDLRFPEPFRALAAKGAEVVFVPANWPVRRIGAWSILLAARAIENQMAVCGVNRVGRDALGLDYPGASALHDAFGEVIAKGDAAAGLVIGDLDLIQLRAWRARFPALSDRRPEVYSAL